MTPHPKPHRDLSNDFSAQTSKPSGSESSTSRRQSLSYDKWEGLKRMTSIKHITPGDPPEATSTRDIHAHMHTYIPTYVHSTYLHAYIPTYAPHTYTYLHICIYTYMNAYIHTYIHKCMHANTHTYTHTHRYERTCIHA